MLSGIHGAGNRRDRRQNEARIDSGVASLVFVFIILVNYS